MARLTCEEVRVKLRARYAWPEYAFMEEFHFGASERRIDALAFSMYASRGHLIEGFEIKVSESDLKAEFESPEKAHPLWERCDRWWLVLGDPDLAESKYVPPTWGVVVPRGRGLGVFREAERNPSPKIDRESLYSVIARVLYQAQKREAADLAAMRKDLRDEVKAELRNTEGYAKQEVRELKAKLESISKLLGAENLKWASEQRIEMIAPALRALRENGAEGALDKLDRSAKMLSEAAASATEQARTLRAALGVMT